MNYFIVSPATSLRTAYWHFGDASEDGWAAATRPNGIRMQFEMLRTAGASFNVAVLARLRASKPSFAMSSYTVATYP